MQLLTDAFSCLLRQLRLEIEGLKTKIAATSLPSARHTTTLDDREGKIDGPGFAASEEHVPQQATELFVSKIAMLENEV